MRRGTGSQIVLVGAVGVLALALNHFLLHWVLLTEATIRRVIF
jgi:hypothetical protein